MRYTIPLGLAAIVFCSSAPSAGAPLARPAAPVTPAIAVRATAGQIWVIASFRAGSGSTGILDSLTSTAAAPQGHTLPATATVDSFIAGPATANASGQFSVRATYAGGVTPSVALPWSYTAPVVVTPPTAPTGQSLVVHATTTQLWLVFTWTPVAGATGYADTLALNQSPWTVLGGHAVAVTPPDSFAVSLPTATTSYFACVRATNSAGTSGTACSSASYTPPLPPGSPTLDSIRIKVAAALYQNGVITVAGSAKAQFCAFGFFSDGSVHSQGSQCDALGSSLYTVRYSARSVPRLELAAR